MAQFEVIPGGASDPNAEAERKERQRIRKENEADTTRALSDAEFIQGGARMRGGKLGLEDEQVIDIKERLRRAESIIAARENPEIDKGLEELREKGKVFAREIMALHQTAQNIKTSRFVASSMGKGSNEEWIGHLTEEENRFREQYKPLRNYFSEVMEFANSYGYEKLIGGLHMKTRDHGVNIEEIAELFESPNELVDAIEQVRDAELYRAHKAKEELTGNM